MVNNKMIVTFMLIAIASLAGAGCSDDNPVVTPTNPIDTAPLDPPANLSLELSKGSAILDWDPTIDVHVVNWVVTRERYGVTQFLGNISLDYSGYVDPNPLSGSSMYHVYSMDNAGRMSAAATVNLTIPLIRQPDRVSD